MPGSTTVLKYLVTAGVGARRACAALIMQGHVALNGATVQSLGQAVDSEDRVSVRGIPVIEGPQQRTYLLLNKPAGYLSAVSDGRGRATVLDLVPVQWRQPGLVPAGRLDLASTGMMILTNDGDLVNQLTHPRFGVEKEYHATLDAPLTASALRQLVRGVPLQSGLAQAVGARSLADSPNGYSIVMTEGRKREVRLMIEAVGSRVRVLHRVRMGGLWLRGVDPGTIRALNAAELKILRQPKMAAVRTHASRARPQPKRGRQQSKRR